MSTYFIAESDGSKLFEHPLQHVTPAVGTKFVIGERVMHVVSVVMQVVTRYSGQALTTTVVLRDGIK